MVTRSAQSSLKPCTMSAGKFIEFVKQHSPGVMRFEVTGKVDPQFDLRELKCNA